jgi:HEAT repeat protein
MGKQRRMAVFFAAVILICGLLTYLFRPSEPVYHGRSLSSWLKQLDDSDHEGSLPWQTWASQRTPSQVEAAEAIRRMGTNSLPFLLHALSTTNSRWQSKFIGWLGKRSWLKISLPVPVDYRRASTLALDALGPAASPATPELAQLLNSQNADGIAKKDAAIALAAIGPDGWAVLNQAVHPSNSWESACAVWALAGHHVTVSLKTITALMDAVTNNPTAKNGAISGWALGELAQERERVIPVLIQGLQSSDMATRWGAACGLGALGTNAVSAVPALLDALHNKDTSTRDNASRALKLIDPGAADKADVK